MLACLAEERVSIQAVQDILDDYAWASSVPRSGRAPGRVGRGLRAVSLKDIEKPKPITSTPTLRTAITKAFKRIESLEEEIATRRDDIKEVKRGLTDKGLLKKGIDSALARRKLLAKDGLDQVDETLAIICGIGSLGIQGELFVVDDSSDENGNGAAT